MAELIDRYWRAANYLTVENMYLKEGLHKSGSNMGILKNLYQAIGELAQALISYMHIFVDI